MADSSNREVGGSPPPVGISEKSKPGVQLGGTNPVEDSTQRAINVSDTSNRKKAGSPTSNREVARSPFPDSILEKGKRVVQHDSKLNVLEQIAKDKGELWKDRNGRFRVVYKDDDNIDECQRCMERVEIKFDDYSSEYRDIVSRFLEGITMQQDKYYPFTVIRNPQQQELITPSKSGSYRVGREYKVIHLYKNPNENFVVKIVKDMVTGFIHICKTTIMREFKCEEVQAMHSLHKIAPEIYAVDREGEHVNIHMELIKGVRLDTVATCMKDEHMWPLCLHIFSNILYAIRILMFKNLSHRDIHSKNIIIEVVENGKLRIRLIDYGGVGVYTINKLITHMRNLVASLLALFAVKAYIGKPDKWIEDNLTKWKQYPKLCFIFKRALEVANEESLRKFIDIVEAELVKNKEKPDFKKSLEEIAELYKSKCSLRSVYIGNLTIT